MAKASDNLFPYMHLVPAAAPASPAAGAERLYLDSGDGNKLKRKSSAGTVTTIEGAAGGAAFTAYASYTPALTATTTNPSLGGAGALAEGHYCQVGSGAGSLVTGRLGLAFGSSPSSGSGEYRVSLPVAAATTPTNQAVIGSGYVYNASGAGIILIAALIADSTHAKLFRVANPPNHLIGAASPAAWQNGDGIGLTFSYEAA